MKNRYLSIILSILLVISLVSDFAFYDLWQQEKDKASELKQRLNEANRQIEALNSNHEQEINKVAADFVEMLFTYDPRVYENGREAALEMAIGEAKEKLMSEQTKNQYGDFNEQDEAVTSLVSVTDSIYNKIGNETSIAMLKFEQEFVIRGIRTKTLNEIKLYVRYVTDEWKIENYEFIQIL